MKYLLILSLSIFSLQLLAQERSVKIEKDGVKITYEFSELKGKRAEEGPKELCIFLLNTKEEAVVAKFTLAFMEDGFAVEESAPMEVCIKPGKEAKGKKLGLCWLITEGNNEKLEAGSFDWELNELTIEKSDGCD